MGFIYSDVSWMLKCRQSYKNLDIGLSDYTGSQEYHMNSSFQFFCFQHSGGCTFTICIYEVRWYKMKLLLQGLLLIQQYLKCLKAV